MPTDTDLCNLAAGKFGGFGDQTTGSGFITDINSATDSNAKWCKILLPECRKKVITDLAIMDCPFRESVKYMDLGAEAADDDIPEIGGWLYAFSLPIDMLAMVAQINEDSLADSTVKRTKYRYETILNKNKNGKLLLTNDYSNTDEDSAFIQYAVDVSNPAGFSQALKECIVVLLAAELCPRVGKDEKKRQSLLIEYEQLFKPNAIVFNQSQYDNYTKDAPTNYFGERN